ncbi:MAG: cytochrome c maturation protein CcmE [Gammaproteobacteria bacterium]|nr:MAG: cytochrome c maturation protein CcmE [Gammaproteobacteria bacterium]PIE36283.1 MAG: cytochrome c maturation protein CcmE [Gammaproteobacteria bacterium]
MTPRRKQRLMLVALLLAGAGTAVTLGLTAFRSNLSLFHVPADIAAGNVATGVPFRLGGMVVDGSVERNEEDLAVRFALTDHQDEVTVTYVGILPDLFREGQGIVARGVLDESGVFVASEVLAKHDENYMPPELADALESSGEMPDTRAKFGATTLVEP